MAEVISKCRYNHFSPRNKEIGWTVIMLNDDETRALTDLLEQHPTLNEDFHVLDELTNAMLGASNG